MKRIFSMLGVALFAWAGMTGANVQNFPEHPITLIVSFPPGGPADALARRLAEGLKDQLRQTIIVENRGGAGGNIGSEYVAAAKPDGYTLLFGTSGPLAINTSRYKTQTYNLQTSFTPIIRIGHLPNILVVHRSLPVNNVQELIAYAKANLNALSYASSGKGASSHLAGILFNTMAGTNILHISYKGTGLALNDLLGNQISMSFTDSLTALPHLNEDGKLRALDLASAQRSPALPDLPTLAEQGLDGYDVSVFFGIVAPKNLLPQTAAILNTAFRKALEQPDVRDTLDKQDIVLATDQTPDGLRAFIATEVPKWRELIRSANVVID